jgi:hypothetical protein
MVEEWSDVVESQKSMLPEGLYDYEMAERDSIGPISPRKSLDERREGIEAYFAPKVSAPEEALLIDTRWLAPSSRSLRPLSLVSASRELQPNTNSGLPFFTKKRLVLEKELEIARGNEVAILVALLFARTTAHGPKVSDARTRNVWGYPASVTIREMAYFRVIQSVLASHPALSAWRTPEEVDTAVFKFMAYAKERGTAMYSTDFSGFDTSLSRQLLEAFGRQFGQYFQNAFREEWDSLIELLITIPLLISEDELLQGDHGMPSGATTTNLGDCDVHRRGQLFVSDYLGSPLNPMCQVQGDDGLLNFANDVDEDRMTDGWLALGLNDNAEKRFVSYERCLYLRRLYSSEVGGGMYPTFRALNSLLGQERFHDEEVWGPELVNLRYLMILENTKWNPLFRAFVSFAQSRDKFRLGADWPGGIDAMLSPKVVQKAESIAGFVPSYNQENRLGGIRNFVTYKLIKESE